jgi:hypothetical protein
VFKMRSATRASRRPREPTPDKPCDRPEWIFAMPDLGLSAFVIVESPASDHLPLAVTVTVERECPFDRRLAGCWYRTRATAARTACR